MAAVTGPMPLIVSSSSLVAVFRLMTPSLDADDDKADDEDDAVGDDGVVAAAVGAVLGDDVVDADDDVATDGVLAVSMAAKFAACWMSSVKHAANAITSTTIAASA